MEKVELVNQLRTSFLKERIASATSASVDIEVKSEESEQPDTMQVEKVFRVIFKGTCLGIVPGFATEEVEAEIIKNAKNELLWLVYGDVIKSCSPLCFGSFPYDNEVKTCQYSIWRYGDQLIKESNVSSPKAYIYVDLDRWKGFTRQDIETLESYGITSAKIFTTNNSKHEVLYSMTDINDLPSQEVFEEIPVQKSSKWYYFILLTIFLMILIIYFKDEIMKYYETLNILS